MTDLKQNYDSWLRLHRAPKLSLRKALECLDHIGDAHAICTAPAAALKQLGMEDETIQWLHSDASFKQIERDLRWLEQDNCYMLTCADAAYPKRLKEIESHPLLIFVSGDIELLNLPMLAIVGPRNPTAGGILNAETFAASLAASGFVIVSGMAKGIDTIAHTAALNAGTPTVAVIGTGPDRVYPKRNWSLSKRIEKQGAIVSEFPCGTKPLPWNFPRRNRLISGLALGTLVVEASERSGSLITAAYAREQNREVFAIPGSIRNPATLGCHRLIQRGAKLVQSAEDITVEIVSMLDLTGNDSLTTPHPQRPVPTTNDPAIAKDGAKDDASDAMKDPRCRRLLDCMEHEESVTADILMERSGLTAAEISAMLLSLELEGYVASQHDTYIRLK